MAKAISAGTGAGAAPEDSPRDGDVIVAPGDPPSALYVIAQVPGPPQLMFGSRDAAVNAARRFAKRDAVDVWLEENSTLTRLASHRSRAPLPSPARR